ncbi:MAG TPA: hypothetical protein VJT71_07510 [Pyrinomonadaceae bacterium]|nr:hypothetical protein [Pyrinomonadaceae bacterium]
MSKLIRKATKIMLIRHAEKPEQGADTQGVTLKGERSKESLAVRGWQRAGALTSIFAPSDGHFQHAALAKPKFLYASKALKRKGSKRSIQTITPLAEKLNLKINDDFPRSQFENMLEEVYLCNGVVLICWQREYIPNIADYILNNDETAPRVWPEDRFDMVWVFDLKRSSAGYGFKQVPQRLLPGDTSTRIS